MRFKIYEIEHSKDKDRVSYMPLKSIEKVEPSIYKKTFDAEADNIRDPEDVFDLFNYREGHPLHNGHSLSVSDIVVTSSGAYFCDTFGFKKIDFDESKVDTSDLVRILYVQPHKAPYVAEIPNTLESFQRAVEGYIEQIRNNDSTAILFDDSAKLRHKEGNRYLADGSIVAGNIIVVGIEDGEWRSLTDEEIKRYNDQYAAAPEILQEEPEKDVGTTMYL